MFDCFLGVYRKFVEVLGYVYVVVRIRFLEVIWVVGEGGLLVLLLLVVGVVDKDFI